jgi:hypothetical protein
MKTNNDDDEIDENLLKELLWLEAETYPIEILKKRLRLLTRTEREKVLKMYNKIEIYIHKIDEVISNRAEIAKDKWEI